MASKTAQIIIQVDDKSLVELNSEIKTLENNIKNLKIGTTEWNQQNEKLGKLKTQLSQATTEAKRLQGTVQKISSAEQLQSIVRLGRGIAGAFAGVQGAVTLLGGSSKAFDEIAARMTSFLALMQGLDAISQTFSRTNLKGLTAVGAGFKNLVTVVKGASTAMKAALISTGIGALLVALGLIIANWDKIKGAITGASRAEKKAFEESQKQGEEIVKGLEEQNRILEQQIKLLEERNKFSTQDNSAIIQKNINIQNEGLKIQSQLRRDAINQIKEQIEEQQKEIDKAQNRLKIAQDTNEAMKWYPGKDVDEKKREERVKAEQNKLDLMNNQIALYEIEIAKLEDEIKFNTEILNVRTMIFEENKAYLEATDNIQKQNENQILILKARGEEEQKIFELERSSLYQQINAINIITEKGGQLTKEEKQRLDNLNAQIEALEIQNNLRIEAEQKAQREYELNIKNLEIQREALINASEMSTYYQNIFNSLDEQNNLLQLQEGYIEQQLEFLKIDEEQDKKKKDFLNNTIKASYRDRRKAYEDELDFYIKTKQLENEKYSIQIKILEKQREILITRQSELSSTMEQNQQNKQILESQLEEAKKALDNIKEGKKYNQERLDAQEKIFDLEKQIADLNSQTIKDKGTIVQLDSEIAKTNQNIETTSEQIVQNNEDINQQTQQINQNINSLNKGFAGWLEKYQEEIQLISQIAQQSMELVAVTFDNAAIRAQERIESLTEELQGLQELQEEHQNNLAAAEEELKDANGQRYEELLDYIDQEKAANEEAKQAVIDKNNEIAKQEEVRKQNELKAARWRKAQAIIDGIIQTALAVIKALPNVFLAVATGVLGAASVATIAAQKVQVYGEGGFTKRDRSNKTPVGVVHANEYVVPARVVQSSSAQQHIAALEKQRLRGYEDGGYVDPNNLPTINSTIDYDRLTQSFIDAVSQLPNPQVGLVNISTGLREVELTKYQSGLAR